MHHSRKAEISKKFENCWDFKPMIYDYGIAGAGIAGCICAYELCKRGKTCIIFEKHKGPAEKVCGGGVSYKALRELETIGIKTSPLFLSGQRPVIGHRVCTDGHIRTKMYKPGNISLGTRRVVLDQYLLNCAAAQGAVIRYGVSVDDMKKQLEDIYNINGCLVKKVIWAIGAKSPSGNAIKGQSIGYSGQIFARSTLPENLFHYWYYENGCDTKYFWAFPIDENLWNVGVWSRYPHRRLKSDYDRCLEKYFLNTILGVWEYSKRPEGEFLGHIDQRKLDFRHINGIGDFAGMCNPKNGGGIIGAIESAVRFVATE